MKNKLIAALMICLCTFSFAQKKELKAAEKAVKSNNFAEAKTYLVQVKSMLSSLDEKSKSKYYFLNGKALYANGAGNNDEIILAIESFNNAKGYNAEIFEVKTEMENNFLTSANAMYKNKNFNGAALGFEKLYKIVPNDTTYLYYAAVSAVSAQDYETAIKHYEVLKDLNYTGKQKVYFAINNETGEEDILEKTTRDLYVKAGTHSQPGDKLTESKRGEIIKNIALIYASLGDSDKAIAAIKEARVQDPKDINLILTEANFYYKNGELDKYGSLIEEATKLDPENIDLFFNLGVLAVESGNVEKAKEYYTKVISMDNNYVNAHTNLAALILSEEESIIEEMNSLGSSAADNKRYDELKEKRKEVYKEAIPYLENVLEIKDDLDIARTLMNIYSSLENDAKYEELKAKVDSLTEGN